MEELVQGFLLPQGWVTFYIDYSGLVDVGLLSLLAGLVSVLLLAEVLESLLCLQ